MKYFFYFLVYLGSILAIMLVSDTIYSCSNWHIKEHKGVIIEASYKYNLHTKNKYFHIVVKRLSDNKRFDLETVPMFMLGDTVYWSKTYITHVKE